MIFKKHFIVLCSLVLTYSGISSQTLALSDQLKGSEDKILETRLLPTLDSLLSQISINRLDDKLLSKGEAGFTRAIFEELITYEISYRDSQSVLRRELLNYYPISKDTYLCKVAYFRQTEDKTRFLQILLSVVAHTKDPHVTFTTPLTYYTNTWKENKLGNTTYYFRNKLRKDRAEKFEQNNTLFASRFNLSPYSFKFFMAENYQEILRLVGFDYKAKSIGQLRDGYGVIANEYIFSVMNNEDFSHDLFHFYSGNVHSQNLRNWVTEEGIAYSWGNAYYTKNNGEMSEQHELLSILKQYLEVNKDIDLLELFENNFWSDKTGIYNEIAPDFSVGRFISSLICDDVMDKHGMDGIQQLITCGSTPTRFDAFFTATDKLIGLSRANFDNRIRDLISSTP